MFDFDLTDELKIKIRKLLKKDKLKVEIINKKIKEIVGNDDESIERYKNLKHDLKHLKRIHIDKRFVLTFRVNKEKNFILFEDFDHHDKIYWKIWKGKIIMNIVSVITGVEHGNWSFKIKP